MHPNQEKYWKPAWLQELWNSLGVREVKCNITRKYKYVYIDSKKDIYKDDNIGYSRPICDSVAEGVLKSST